MEPLNPFRQSAGLCGPASLKILLNHYGKDYTEDELAELCRATADKGTDHAGLVEAVRAIGYEPLVKDMATVAELRGLVEQEIPVIVGWYSTDEDHYSVVYDVDDENVSMMDPELDEGIRVMPIPEFETVWYDFDSGAGDRVERWMLAVPGLKRVTE